MNINKLTPVKTSKVSNIKETIAPKAKKFTDKIIDKIDYLPARLNLELNAENLSPQEYIKAREYLSTLEFSEYANSERILL